MKETKKPGVLVTREDTPEKTGVKAAPAWALEYVARMVALFGYKRLVRVVVVDDAWFDQVHPNAGGYCVHEDDGSEEIGIRASAEPTEKWYMVLAHEFGHALHTDMDRLAELHFRDEEVQEMYDEAIEAHVIQLGALIHFAMEIQVEAQKVEVENEAQG